MTEHTSHTLLFMAIIAIIPLAGWLLMAIEEIANDYAERRKGRK